MTTIIVLMTAFLETCGKRGELYLRRAIESILCQTHREFKFLIVNDSPRPRAIEIAELYNDPRIVCFDNQRNIGLTASLNAALKYIDQTYILRQDADDVSHPKRLETLLAEIEKDPSVAVIGDNYGVLNEVGEHTITNGSDPEKLATDRLAGSIAGTSLFRTSAVKEVGGWRYQYAQDFYMLVKLRQAGYKIKTVRDTLYYYQQHAGQISQAKKAAQKACHREIIEKECG